MLAKLIAWGATRDEAASRMARALDELRVDGIRTSINFHRRVMTHPAFLSGALHTGFLTEHPELTKADGDSWLQEVAVLAAAIAHFRRLEQLSAQGGTRPAQRSAWRRAAPGWRR
jgi:acetyl/propionyl-CoA carboxylase alpha subunit